MPWGVVVNVQSKMAVAWGLGGNGPQAWVAMISCPLCGSPSQESILVPIAQMRTLRLRRK